MIPRPRPIHRHKYNSSATTMTVPDVLQDASNFHNDTDKLMSAINVGIGHQLKMYSVNAPAGVCRNMWCKTTAQQRGLC